MNENITHLALKSYLLNYVDNETPRTYFISGNADIEEVELFARLIIEEIINLKYADESFSTMMKVSFENKLRKHFGIE
jgi:hypothetical protein